MSILTKLSDLKVEIQPQILYQVPRILMPLLSDMPQGISIESNLLTSIGGDFIVSAETCPGGLSILIANRESNLDSSYIYKY